jgi:hypothetical protein
MGGDDLGSDDEFLSERLNKGHGNNVDEEHDSDDEYSMEGAPSNAFLDDAINDTATTSILVNTSKRKRDTQKEMLLKEGGRKLKERRGEVGPFKTFGIRIRQEPAESKADLLSRYAAVKFLPQHIAKAQTNGPDGMRSRTMDSNNFMDRLLCLISKKQLKKTRKGSPRVIIVCLSARRCVSVLKDLAPLKLRVAKLFPKQGTIDDQAAQVESTEFSVAVGTPHRIKELMERKSLSFNNTHLFGLDTFENEKCFTVYTLPDTSCHTQELLKEHVHVHLTTNKGKLGGDVKVAFI